MNALHEVSSKTDPLNKFPGDCELLEERTRCAIDALDCLLEAAIDHSGYSARDVFDAAFNFKAITRHHERAFEISYANLLVAVTAIGTNNTSNSNIFNLNLALSPCDEEPFVSVNWNVEFESDWVARRVIKELGHAVCQQIGILDRKVEDCSR